MFSSGPLLPEVDGSGRRSAVLITLLELGVAHRAPTRRRRLAHFPRRLSSSGSRSELAPGEWPTAPRVLCVAAYLQLGFVHDVVCDFFFVCVMCRFISPVLIAEGMARNSLLAKILWWSFSREVMGQEVAEPTFPDCEVE